MKSKIHVLFIIIYIASFSKALAEFIPAFENSITIINVCCDLLLMYLGITTFSKAPQRILFCLIIFLGISTINFFISSGSSIINHLNGLREFINIFCIFIFLNEVFKSEYQNYFNILFKKFAWIYLLTQLPVTFIQFLLANFKAGDVVGGTLGKGGSGTLTFSIFILVYYLIENRGTSLALFSKIKYLLSLSILFLPIILNETKVSFILIPLFFITLLNIKEIKSSILNAFLAFLLLTVFSALYTDKGKMYKNPLEEIFSKDFLENYLAGDEDLYEDVPRLTKIVLGYRMASAESSTFLFGEEYGAFKGGNAVSVSAFAKKYNWLLQGSRPYFFYVFITGGLTLLLIVLYLFIMESINKPYPDFKKYSSRLIVFLFCIFTMILFYNDAFRELSFLIIFSYVLFYSKYYRYKERQQ